jgi:site-specific recombinase XerC
MSPHAEVQRIFTLVNSLRLALDVQSFLLDAQARNLTAGTLRFYTQKLYPLVDYLETMDIQEAEQVSAVHLRQWLVHLQSAGHNPGGVHGFYRAAKAFFTWLTREEEIARNPVARVRAPRCPRSLLSR